LAATDTTKIEAVDQKLSAKIDTVDQKLNEFKVSVEKSFAELAVRMERMFADVRIGRAYDRVWWLTIAATLLASWRGASSGSERYNSRRFPSAQVCAGAGSGARS